LRGLKADRPTRAPAGSPGEAWCSRGAATTGSARAATAGSRCSRSWASKMTASLVVGEEEDMLSSLALHVQVHHTGHCCAGDGNIPRASMDWDSKMTASLVVGETLSSPELSKAGPTLELSTSALKTLPACEPQPLTQTEGKAGL
ncbi:unnamed protein product, partial [Prorocentrum cordatum]